MGNDLVNHTKKLKIASNFALERDALEKEFEELAKVVEEKARLT